MDVLSNGLAIVHSHATSASPVTTVPTGWTEDFEALGGGAMVCSGGRFTNDGTANLGEAFTTSWRLVADPATPIAINNYRHIGAAFGAAI
jgi:hypothetical protein